MLSLYYECSMISCLSLNLFSCMPSAACNNHQNDIEDAKYLNVKAQTDRWGKISQSLPFRDAATNAAFPSSPPPPSLLLWQYNPTHTYSKNCSKRRKQTMLAIMSHAVYLDKNKVFLIEGLFPSGPRDEGNQRRVDQRLWSICYTGGMKSETNTNSSRCCITWGLLSHFFWLY